MLLSKYSISRAVIIYSFLLSGTASATGALVPIISILLDDSRECIQQAALPRDEFDCDAVTIENSPWQFVNRDGVNIDVANGELTLELTQRLLWFNNSRGVLMYQTVDGDFKATTSVRVYKSSASEMLPDLPVQLAGLMARRPDSDQGSENYVFIVVGFDVNDISVETKSTVNGQSDFEGPSWPNGQAELRICRIGDAFYSYKRMPGETVWQVADDSNTGIPWPLERADMNGELQLGINIYTAESQFDVSASFDYFRVEAVANVMDCTVD